MTIAPTVDPPVSVATVKESPSVSDEDVISHVESLFQSFAKSLKVWFSSIDERFSQVIGSSTSNADVNRPIVSSQDVANPSFPAPFPVALRYEHPPAQAPYAPYSDGLGKTPEGTAAVRLPVGISSLPKLAFSALIDRVRVCKSLMGFVPDSEFSVAISGNSLADSVHSFRQHLSDPHDPVPCTSEGGDNVIHLLYRLVASSGSSPQLALGATGEHGGEGLDSFGVIGFPASSLTSSVTASASFLHFSSPALSSFLPSVSSLLRSPSFLCPLLVLGLLLLLLVLSPLLFPSTHHSPVAPLLWLLLFLFPFL